VGWEVRLGAEVSTTLLVSGTSVQVGTEAGTFVTVSRTGEITDEISIPGLPFGTPLALGRDRVLLLDGNVVARIAPDGTIRWAATTDLEWTSFRPLLWRDRVWVGNEGGELVALDPDTGEVLTSLQVDGAVRGFTFDGDTLLVGTLGGLVHSCPVPEEAR